VEKFVTPCRRSPPNISSIGASWKPA
jgi:hypothetical protein